MADNDIFWTFSRITVFCIKIYRFSFCSVKIQKKGIDRSLIDGNKLIMKTVPQHKEFLRLFTSIWKCFMKLLTGYMDIFSKTTNINHCTYQKLKNMLNNGTVTFNWDKIEVLVYRIKRIMLITLKKLLKIKLEKSFWNFNRQNFGQCQKIPIFPLQKF